MYFYIYRKHLSMLLWHINLIRLLDRKFRSPKNCLIKYYMLNTIRLILTFYRSYLFAALVITFICLFIYNLYGIHTFVFLFWFKIVTLGLIYYFVNDYKKKEFYYYRNLGVSSPLLWITTLLCDFALFLSLLILVHKIR